VAAQGGQPDKGFLMIVAFPYAFNGHDKEENKEFAGLFVRAARRFDFEIVQMTDSQTQEIKGVDSVFRHPMEELGPWYLDAMEAFPADQFLRVDYDILFRADVSDVFDDDFDIAVAKEPKIGVMNNGVVFVKDKAIFADARQQYEKTSRDNWSDIQVAMSMSIDSGKFSVKKLPADVFNCFYKREWGKTLPDTAKLVHFKGSRKDVMRDHFTTW
jgi:hypothetical protein